MKKPHKTLHKYMRQKFPGGYIIFRCMLPDCPHYVPRYLALGRSSLCWECEKPMEIKRKHLDTKKPKCWKCSGGKVRGKIMEKLLVEENKYSPEKLGLETAIMALGDEDDE